jgi:hypothetical protein
MAILLSCGLCGVKAVNGFLSRNLWGHLESNPHSSLHACPVCLEKHPHDWEARLRAANPAALDGSPRKRDPYGRSWTL